jgi:hypothetical protein
MSASMTGTPDHSTREREPVGAWWHPRHHVGADDYVAIRRSYYVEGRSVHAIAHALHVTRHTVKKILFPWPE